MPSTFNYNDKKELHGYQEVVDGNRIVIRGNSKNDEDIGYQEYHTPMPETRYNII
jgi:hypothetical protein